METAQQMSDSPEPQKPTRLIDRLTKGTLGNIIMVAGGSVIGQGLTVLFTPLLTRMYSPVDFGVLGVFTSLLTPTIAIAALRYEMAVPLPDTDEDAVNVVAVCLFVLGIMVSLYALVAGVFGHQIVGFAKTPQLAKYLFLLPLGLLCGGLYNIFSFWTTRQRRFKVLSATKAMQGIGMTVVQVGSGAAHFGPIGLVLGFVAGQGLGVNNLIKGAKLPWNAISKERMRKVAREFGNFPRFTAAANLFNLVGQLGPAYFFSAYFSPATAGQFGMTIRVLTIPIALIGVAVQQVLYPSLVKIRDDKAQAADILEKAATSLYVLAFCLFSLLLISGPYIFQRAFGQRWGEAGHFAQIMAPWFICNLASATLSAFALIKGKQLQAMLLTVYEVSLRSISVAIGIYFHNIDLAVGLYTCAGTIIAIVYLEWILRLGGSNTLTWLKKLKALPILGVAAVAALSLVGKVLGPHFALLTVVLSVAVLFGGAFLFLKSDDSMFSSKLRKQNAAADGSDTAPVVYGEESV